MGSKLWGGRFREETDTLVNRFNASIGFDWRLYPYDIQASIAHCRMLANQGIISHEEATEIVRGLGEIKRSLDREGLPLAMAYEDIHGFVESALVEKIGPIGEKLHTGRSRNDQVATDVRLFVRDATREAILGLEGMQKGLVRAADRHLTLVMPGYTHLQRAQPVLLAHHLLAYYEMFQRDRQRLQESLKRTNVLPLGSAALAGSTFPLDRAEVAGELGFEEIAANSMDAVSDRDFVIEFLFCASLIMMHLSRLCEELILWSSAEFDFIDISDAFCTGSSIMPQKKNPDVPELVRGKTGRVYGHLISLLTTLKGLPLTYNKDMQEDKEALFDAVDTLSVCLDVMSRLMEAVNFHEKVLEKAAAKGYLVATDLADYLVNKGIPFREAHRIVGRAVLHALDQCKELHELGLDELRGFSRQIDETVYGWLDPEEAIRRRNLPGGTGFERVAENLSRAKRDLGL